jgi:hypothetical protein
VKAETFPLRCDVCGRDLSFPVRGPVRIDPLNYAAERLRQHAIIAHRLDPLAHGGRPA